MNTPKYMISEIVIKRKDGEHIGELVEILQKDPRFELYAAQFSQSASAPSGGKLGWVAAGQLAAPLDKVVRSLKEGQVSQAVPYRADYYIFKWTRFIIRRGISRKCRTKTKSEPLFKTVKRMKWQTSISAICATVPWWKRNSDAIKRTGAAAAKSKIMRRNMTGEA